MSVENTGNVREMLGGYAALARKGARYWRRAVALAVVALAGGMIWVLTRPRTFRSEASAAIHDVTVDSSEPRAPEEAQAELRARLDQVYGSRANLGRVIEELRLYPWLSGRTSQLKIIEAFQGALEYTANGRDAFHLAFVYKDPAVAQRVVERLLRLYTDERRAAGESAARNDLASVETAIAGLETVLTDQEERLERFERANHDLVEQVRLRRLGQTQLRAGLPGALPFAAAMAAPVASEPGDSGRTRRLRLRLAALQSRLATLSRAEARPAAAHAAPAAPVEESERVQALRRSVTELRDRLARLRTTYTDAYPDVRITARRLAEAERELASAVAQERSRSRASAQAAAPPAASAADRAAQITSVQREIEATRGELAASVREDRAARARAPAVAAGSQGAAAGGGPAGRNETRPAPEPEPEPQSAQAAAPASEIDRPLGSLVEVESSWDRLMAELGTTRTRYQQLLARKFELQAMLDTVNSTGADVLRVIDPPSLPAEPEPPGRTKLSLIVLALALFLGVGVAGLSGFLDGHVYEPADLRRWGELPELPAIPEIAPVPRPARAAPAQAAAPPPPG